MIRRLRIKERSGRARRAAGLAALLALALMLGALPMPSTPVSGPAAVAAASATPSPPAGDLRSSGEGAGAAGNPGFALIATLGVIGAGILIAGATTAYVRLTSHSPDGP